MKHLMPQLPYAAEALAPHMSKETIDYHYGKHLQTYVDNLNRLIEGTPFEQMTLEDIVKKSEGALFNNAAQTWNHAFFFLSFTPTPTPMPQDLSDILAKEFGSVENFKDEFTKASLGLFGSGWVWLSIDQAGKLHISAESNAGNPLKHDLTPLLCIDVWEHSYYIDYRNRRADYIKEFWQIVDWNKVAERI